MPDFNSQHNRVVWVDIPVTNLDRAMKFYSAVLKNNVKLVETPDCKFAVLDHENGNGGCLVEHPGMNPGNGGILVYMNTDDRIREAVSQVESHGGSVLEPIHSIAPHGFCAVIRDSEGNRLALHSNTDA